MLSGGAASYVTAKRVIERYGKENTFLLFADTRTEDADLYRFLSDIERVLDMSIIKPSPAKRYEGMNIWDVFMKDRMIAKNGAGICTERLKQNPCDAWITSNFPDPESVTVWVGIDVWEAHRLLGTDKKPGLAARKLPYTYKSILLEKPYLLKPDMLKILEGDGIAIPRLYNLGFEHNNCGGFCVKAGKAHFKNLLENLPDVYAYHEERERVFREHVGKDVSVLVDVIKETGEKPRKIPLTLEAFRERVEAEKHGLLQIDWHGEEIAGGGCGCFAA